MPYPNETIAGIMTRRSVRDYTDQPVDDDVLDIILTAGAAAPSGKNNQPWRFVIVRNPELKQEMAGLTHYGRIIEKAPVVTAVFLDKQASYQLIKDHQAVGACLQNILLAAHSLGLGAVWLGEILKNGPQVCQILGLGDQYDLMAVVAFGHPQPKERSSTRLGLDELVLKRFA
ncbi:MAG: nitroreductase family protein [Deltaproteobacteria bacterium]|nr:nitroreductase family protein [Deltaproteobacteria bacterium]